MKLHKVQVITWDSISSETDEVEILVAEFTLEACRRAFLDHTGEHPDVWEVMHEHADSDGQCFRVALVAEICEEKHYSIEQYVLA